MDKINAGIAQLVEQLICNQQVVGSNPTAGFRLNILISSVLRRQRSLSFRLYISSTWPLIDGISPRVPYFSMAEKNQGSAQVCA
jgi:hypothetical protein